MIVQLYSVIRYIHGFEILLSTSEQIIRGTDLRLSTQDLSGLRGFGASLASGVDVDMNSYNGKVIARTWVNAMTSLIP